MHPDIILPEKRNGTRLIYTSHSVDNVFDYCERKFEFLNVWDRRPPRDSGFAAMVGTALHEGVGAWLIGRAEGKSEADATSAGFMALLKWYPWDTEHEQPTQVRSIYNSIALFYAIIRSHEWDNWELLRVEGRGWAVEIPFVIVHVSMGEFVIKATGETAMMATQGKIDFVLRHRFSGKIRTWDLKTTIKDKNLIRSEYYFSGQQVGYGQVVRAMLQEEAFDDFDVRYMVARFNSTEPPEVECIDIGKDGDDIDDYWLAKISRLNRMRHAAESGWFHRTNGGCNSWNHECSCFDICKTRDPHLIRRWFYENNMEPTRGYEPWVTLEV